MRHCKSKGRFGRRTGHREAMLAEIVCGLIRENHVRTTVTKAKAARRIAEKMVTLGKQDTIAARRNAFSALRQRDAVQKLFGDVAPRCRDRSGGYTRILKLYRRAGDRSEIALLEWVDRAPSGDSATSDPAA